MKFFGIRYSAPAYEGMECVETPVGSFCAHCDEWIVAGDDGWSLPHYGGPYEPKELAYHRACFMRSTIGSVAHQQRRCSCFVPGSTEEDDPTLTRRQAAEAALAYFDRYFDPRRP